MLFVLSLSQAISQQPITCDPCPPWVGCTLWVVQPPITQGIDGCDFVIKWMVRTCSCNNVTRDELPITEITVTIEHCNKTELQMGGLFKDAVNEVIYYYSW